MITMRSGVVTGTGVAIDVPVGFSPDLVKLTCSESSIHGFWHISMREGTFNIQHCAELRVGEILIGSHLPLIGTTDTQLANTRCVTQHDAAGDVRVEVAAVAAGTAFGAGDNIVGAGAWGCYRMAAASGGAISITPDTSLANATEAAAIANMGALPANEADLGYVTVQGHAAGWNTGTDALAGGTTGTPAVATNYYAGYGVMANGVSPLGLDQGDPIKGFRIGTSAYLNVVGSVIYYEAYRY